MSFESIYNRHKRLIDQYKNNPSERLLNIIKMSARIISDIAASVGIHSKPTGNYK